MAEVENQGAGMASGSAFTSGPFGQGLLALILLGGTGVALFSARHLGASVPVLFVGGLFVLMLALGGLAALLASISLSEHRDAFGLPPGTIRALLAIGLLVVFVVFGIGNLHQLASSSSSVGEPIVSTMVPEADVATTVARYELAGLLAVPAAPNADKAVEIHLYRRNDASEANDLAKQLMTMISTLLTTVVGFYFGSRSAGESPANRGLAGAGAGLAADVELASRELDVAMERLQPTLALIEELRAKALTDEQKARVLPLQADVDRRLAEVRSAQDAMKLQLQIARTAADATSTATDAAVAVAERQKAAAALSDAQGQLRSLATLVSGLEQATAALRDATAEG